jgi:hypothetical protein
MSTIRTERSSYPAVIEEEVALDPRLSLAAKGLIAVLYVYDQKRSPNEHPYFPALDHVDKSELEEALRELVRHGLVDEHWVTDITQENGGR